MQQPQGPFKNESDDVVSLLRTFQRLPLTQSPPSLTQPLILHSSDHKVLFCLRPYPVLSSILGYLTDVEITCSFAFFFVSAELSPSQGGLPLTTSYRIAPLISLSIFSHTTHCQHYILSLCVWVPLIGWKLHGRDSVTLCSVNECLRPLVSDIHGWASRGLMTPRS